MAHLCHSAASIVAREKGEEPFYYRKTSEDMMFLLSGLMEYFSGPDAGHSIVSKGIQLKGGEHLTEAPLWVQWEHKGLLSVSETPCTVLQVSSYKFRKALSKHGPAFQSAGRYASLF